MKKIAISISNQFLTVIDKNSKIHFPISSAKNGIGYQEGSFCTPLGYFKIAEKHGFSAPINTIFKGRKPIGNWQGEALEKDLILTRILWLDGLESKNKNTKERYIYIHGTNQEELIGKPASCGCIRMLNKDIIKLYDLVSVGSIVEIKN